MKKITKILCGSFLLMLMTGWDAAAQLPFTDGFESGGFITGGWIVSGAAQVSTQSPSQGAYCAEGPSTWGLIKNFPAITDSFVNVKFDIKASQTNTTCLIFRIKDAIGNTSAGIIFNDQGQIVGVDGGGGNLVSLKAYDAQIWYHIHLILDMTTKKYDIYIDNLLLADDFDFFSPGFTMPYDFSWSSLALSGSAWLDDVNIFSGSTMIHDFNTRSGDVKLFPNPVNNLLFIEDELNCFCNWSIADETGKKWDAGKFTGTRKIIAVSRLTPGIYILNLSNPENQRVCQKKIIIE